MIAQGLLGLISEVQENLEGLNPTERSNKEILLNKMECAVIRGPSCEELFNIFDSLTVNFSVGSNEIRRLEIGYVADVIKDEIETKSCQCVPGPLPVKEYMRLFPENRIPEKLILLALEKMCGEGILKRCPENGSYGPTLKFYKTEIRECYYQLGGIVTMLENIGTSLAPERVKSNFSRVTNDICDVGMGIKFTYIGEELISLGERIKPIIKNNSRTHLRGYARDLARELRRVRSSLEYIIS